MIMPKKRQGEDLISLMARATSVVGGVVEAMCRRTSPRVQAMGAAPKIPQARRQGILTLEMPVAEGWKDGRLPICADGPKVNVFAEDLDHPRWIEVLPNRDVLVSQSKEQPAPPRSLMDHSAQATMRRVKAIGKSANRVTLLRDEDADGAAETRYVFVQGQNQLLGMSLFGNRFYLDDTDRIKIFDYSPGATRLKGDGCTFVTFKHHRHWTRSLIFSPDRTKIYAGVGSLTNSADQGMEAEEGRGAIWELDFAAQEAWLFATGLRNPVGMA